MFASRSGSPGLPYGMVSILKTLLVSAVLALAFVGVWLKQDVLIASSEELLGRVGNSSEESVKSQDEIPQHLVNVDVDKIDWKSKDETYWRSVLSPEQFSVCREAGTERPFSGKYCKTYSDGDYHCYGCGQKLFDGGAKFDSGTGWPSFNDASIPGSITERRDTSHGMLRTEALCSRCGAHLGHLFDDGPPPTGKRFCINSVCLYKEP